MSKLFDYGENLEKKTTEVLQECDNLVNLSFQASGLSVMDVLKRTDTKTMTMIDGCMKLYSKLEDLTKMEAKAMDEILDTIKDLKTMNECMYNQNKEMQSLLHDLNCKVSKTKD